MRDFDSKYYKVSISAAKNADGVMVYNIGRMKEEAFPKIKGSSATNGNGPRGNASVTTVSHDSGNVKQRFSLKSPVVVVLHWRRQPGRRRACRTGREMVQCRKHEIP